MVPQPHRPRGRRLGAVLGVLLLATAAVYLPVGGYGFIRHDDGIYVYGNPRVTAGLTAEGARWALTAAVNANWHPLTWLSHMLDVSLFGLEAGRHHLVNLLLHLGNTTLLLFALRTLTGALWPSAAVAALFALHPLHVESVAWISERKDLLSTFFLLLSLLAWTSHVRRPGRLRLLAAAVAFALGLAAKAMVMTLPLLLLLLDFWPLGRLRSGGDRRPAQTFTLGALGRAVAEKVPLLLLTGLSIVASSIALQSRSVITPAADYPLFLRVLNTPAVYLGYMAKTLWPSGLALLLNEPPPHYPAWHLAAAWVSLIAVTAAVLLAVRRHPCLATGWLWFLIALAPVVGLVHAPGLTRGDRYTYLPLVGLFVGAAWVAADLAARRGRRALAGVAAASLAFVLAVLSRGQVAHWRDHRAVLSRAVAVAPGNAAVQAAMGAQLLADGDAAVAARHFREALRLSPGDAAVALNLGLALSRQGDLEGAIAGYREALRLDPSFELARRNLRIVLERKRVLAGSAGTTQRER